MPVARIDLLEVCSQEQKERLVRDVEQVISKAISVPVNRVKIVLVDQTLLVDTAPHTAYVC
ncbi:tautomerase family protein [Pontibacterium granulatum]|uniref:tautomerase family protein n=1 Tax=Pontibacterium granulatum TaxID=2036029 RepID=UPI00249BEC75|nr:tautomerase family protein [Pontibacterium granulatum]MDI3326255.1 tautomerase family protein [Pontibacterium granulatum]